MVVLVLIQGGEVFHLHLLKFELVTCFDQPVDLWLAQVVEPSLSEAVESGEAFGWVQVQGAFEKLESLWAHFADVAAFKGLGFLNIREFKTDESWVLVKFFLLTGSQFSKNFLDAEELVDLRLTREESLAIRDLAHDAARCPDVHFFAVVVAQKQFWRPVPPGRHVVSQAGRARFVAEHSGKAKVADLEHFRLRVDQQILRLDVSMDHVIAVTVLDRLENLVQIPPDVFLIQAVCVLF